MTQYDRLKNGSATVAQIEQEIATKSASRPLYKRIPAHILVEDYLVPHNLQVKDVSQTARIHPAVMARFIRGEERINEYMALKLGSMFKTGKDYWLDIQAAYDDGKLN